MSILKSRNLYYTYLFLLISQFLSAQNKPEFDLSEPDLQQLHMVTYKRTYSKNYNSWSIQYHEFKKESKEFQIPITLSFGKTNMDKGFLESKNIKNVDTYSFGFGFDGYEYLGSGFYFNLGVGVPLGLETIESITENKNTNFLISGSINTGLLYIPFPDFGLVLKGKIEGKLSNSKVLSSSFGFSIEVGINF